MFAYTKLKNAYLDRKSSREDLLGRVEAQLVDASPAEYHWVLNKAAMNRPWRPMPVGWANVADQLLHAAYAIALIAPLLFLPDYFGEALTGLVAGTIRETEQYFKIDLHIKMPLDRALDISSFVIGALLLRLLIDLIS